MNFCTRLLQTKNARKRECMATAQKLAFLQASDLSNHEPLPRRPTAMDEVMTLFAKAHGRMIAAMSEATATRVSI
jgi:hypothetical protein